MTGALTLAFGALPGFAGVGPSCGPAMGAAAHTATGGLADDERGSAGVVGAPTETAPSRDRDHRFTPRPRRGAGRGHVREDAKSCWLARETQQLVGVAMSLAPTNRAAVIALLLAACGGAAAPQLKVIGVERAHRDNRTGVILVEVVNRAPRAMRLERLQYTFGADAHREAHGDIALDRTVDAGGAVVVQVPVDLVGAAPGEKLQLHGELRAHQNDLQRTFPIEATLIAPPGAPDDAAPSWAVPAELAPTATP